MGLHGRAFQANIFIVDMVFLENMAPERLCLGCGLRVDEKFTPIFPGERGTIAGCFSEVTPICPACL